MNKLQNTAYDSSKLFDSLSIPVWSIDRFSGVKISFVKWKKICGDNQKILSIVSEKLLPEMLCKFSLTGESINLPINSKRAINNGKTFIKAVFRDSISDEPWFKNESFA